VTPAAEASDGTAGRLVVGLVRGVHGLDGVVRVEVLTDDPTRFEAGSVLHPEGTQRELTVIEARSDRPPGLLVRFREVRDRRGADDLRDTYLEGMAALEAMSDERFYWHEIIGTPVLTRGGQALGAVEDIFRVAETEVYVVRGEGQPELLVPAVGSVVVELAPRAGRIVVDEEALGLNE
jgi:16S rRNA processing protein RimM